MLFFIGMVCTQTPEQGLLFKLILISYKLMQQGTFNFFKEGSSVEKIQMLEEKITKVINKLKF